MPYFEVNMKSVGQTAFQSTCQNVSHDGSGSVRQHVSCISVILSVIMSIILISVIMIVTCHISHHVSHQHVRQHASQNVSHHHVSQHVIQHVRQLITLGLCIIHAFILGKYIKWQFLANLLAYF